jgi:teichuronic acid biosynthesis glycosyltransferase TuaH
VKRPAGDWRGLIVIVAGSHFDGVQYASQHVARALSRYAPVLYVDPPRAKSNASASRWSLLVPRLRVVQPRLAVLNPPALPGASRAAIAALARRGARLALRRASRLLGGDVAAVLLFAPSRRLFGAAGEQLRVYYAKDDFSTANDLIGGSAEKMRADEEWAAATADLVVAHSPTLMERWHAYDPLFVPNGVDVEAFASVDTAPRPPDVDLPRPIVGFIGLLSNRIDFAMLEELAQRGYSLLLIGPRQSTFTPERIERLVARTNVEWIGERSYDQLASYLSVIDVGVVPYTLSPFNRASFPLKTLEYLAAGRPVVSTDLPAVQWLGAPPIRIAGTAEAFADACAEAIGEGLGEEAVERRRTLAREHTWDARARVLSAALGLGESKATAPEPHEPLSARSSNDR